MFSSLFQDIRFGLRLLAKSPAITINAVATLALAIGANSAVFSVVNSILLRPLPFARPDRLVMLWETNPQRGQQTERVAGRDYVAWRAQSSSFDNLGAFTPFSGIFDGESSALRLVVCRVTSNLFPMLGVTPRLGRSFLPEEESSIEAAKVIILSDGLWRRLFGADPNIVGKTMRSPANLFTIIGVMPPEVHFPTREITPGWGFLSGEAELFEPLVVSLNTPMAVSHQLSVVGRLKSALGFARADAEIKMISRRLESQYPDSNAGWGASIAPMTEQVVREARPALRVFSGAVLFVLLIACANVASLLLVRNSARQKELSIRRAMGAAEGRLLRQLLTESVLISLAGGMLGILLAVGAVHALLALAPDALPRFDEIRIDGRTLGFTILVSISTGLLCGLMPALQSRKAAPFEILKAEGRGAAGSRGRIRVQQILVAAEIAMSMLLLAGAGLLLRSYLRLQSVNPGFRTERVLSLQVTASPALYPNANQLADLFQRMDSRIAALPGVRASGGISSPPLTAFSTTFPLTIEGRPETLTKPQTVVGVYGVTPGYFSAMGMTLERGRFLSEIDKRGGTLMGVISRSLADRFWPKDDPIGKRIKVDIGVEMGWLTIVGVVGDVRFQGLAASPTLAVYHPVAQQAWRAMAFAVRTDGPPQGLIPAIRREVAAIDRELPVYNITPVETMLDDSIAKPRFQMLLVLTFAAVALVLAVVGAYGVMSYSVGQRTQEIGVRMAMGASPADVLRMILREALLIIAIGCAAGLAGALACGRLIAGFLFQTAPTDLGALAGISAILAGATLLASFLPARRATRVDPMTALRQN